MLNNTICILILIFFFNPLPVQAITLDLGIAANENSMIISNQDLSDIAEISSGLTFSPTISLKSDYVFFDKSQWGYFYELSYNTLHLDKQGSPESVDVGTAIDGTYAHFTPTIFYRLGDPAASDFMAQAGLGIGVGYLDIHGNFITDKVYQASKIDMDGSGFGFSVGLYFEAQSGNWITRINGYGPVIDIGPNTYQYIDVTISLSYRFYFEL